MTKVIAGGWRARLFFLLALGFSIPGWAQPAPAPQQGAAESLYLELRNVGLDNTRVFTIRDASLDRGALHFTLEDGTIAFTQDVAGRTTGAFFEGDGEVLLSPPNQVERSSMALFTGAAILDERFSTAYFRFNDETFRQLQPMLRPAGHGPEFVLQWNETARNLAQIDALRLMMTFSESLPVDGQADSPPPDHPDHLLHARVQGRSLGAFDLYYDTTADEQIWVGQGKMVDGVTYYDIWSSFTIESSHTPAPRNEQPGESRSDSADVSVSRFKIRASIHLPTDLAADTTMDVAVNRGGQRALLFELSRFLEVKQVEADGQPVEFIHNQAREGSELARLGDDLIAVIFPRPLHTGQHVRLEFSYAGQVLSEAGGGLVYVGARGTWYPNRRPAMSDFDLEFHYPAGWTLVATGKRVDPSSFTASGETGEQVSHWISERSLPVAGFNLGKYEQASSHAGHVLVTTYASTAVEQSFPRAPAVDIANSGDHSGLTPAPKPMVSTPSPPSPARNAQKVADTAAEAIAFFERNFGPYPYGSLALTQRPGTLSQGWPGLVFLSSFSFLNEGEQADLSMGPVVRTLSTGVIAHETAHQWWGDLVSWSGYRDQWLVEALAEYSSLMLLETKDPARFRAVLESYRNDLLSKNKEGKVLMEAGPVTLGTRLSSSRFPSGYEAISYGRGAWLLHMLRNMMRDAEARTAARNSSRDKTATDPFLRALRRVRDRYAGLPLTTEEFVHTLEEDLPRPLWHEGHKSLDWFYEGWINGTAVPRFELAGVKYADKAGAGVALTGTIVRTEAPDDLVTLVPIYAVIAGKTVLLGQVFSEDHETPFRLTAPAGTRKVVLDPNHTLLTRNK